MKVSFRSRKLETLENEASDAGYSAEVVTAPSADACNFYGPRPTSATSAP